MDDPDPRSLDIREGDDARPGASHRPFLQVYFRCANFYQRVYRNADGSAYVARCPKCSKSIRFAVGPGGTSQRAFEVEC
jgi:hypothetical protein